MEYNFDTIIDRTGSHDVKHELLGRRFGREDLLPLWVADMDFATPPFIIDAIRKRLEHPILGYTLPPEQWGTSIQKWIADHHQWFIKSHWFTYVPGVVKGIGIVVNALLKPEERVIIQPPVYHPFRITPEGNRHEVVNNPLKEIRGNDGLLKGYEMDFEGLERLAADPLNRLLILCNPHNPGGIVWSRETLERVAKICAANNVLVLSDEIHCDLALFGHKHIPFASVSTEAERCSITLGAPSKTFNMAGVVSSYIIVPNEEIRHPLFRWMASNEFNEAHIFAPIATIAAFEEGEEWRRQMLAYIEKNIIFVEDFLTDNIPAIKPLRPQASFLVWLDCKGLELSHTNLIDLFVNQAHLALNDGVMFGPGGEGFMRLNVASPKSVLEKALQELKKVIK